MKSEKESKKETLYSDTLAMIKAIENGDQISLCAYTNAHIRASLDKIMGVF